MKTVKNKKYHLILKVGAILLFTMVSALYADKGAPSGQKIIREFETWVKQVEKLKQDFVKGKIDEEECQTEMFDRLGKGMRLAHELTILCDNKELSEKDCAKADELERRGRNAIDISADDASSSKATAAPKNVPTTNTLKKDGQDVNVVNDSRDGKAYQIVNFKGIKWMAENLNYAINGSVCYENNDANCEKYGRLYTWNQAKKACPKGWRLPSNNEWNNAPVGVWNIFAGYFYVTKETFYKKDATAFYWTGTEVDSQKAFDKDMNAGSELFVEKSHSKTDVAFSVRCVKDLKN
jgi:hypothetical protein